MKQTVFVLALSTIALIGCGADSSSSRPVVTGYDDMGNYQVNEGLLPSEACPQIGTPFTDLCLDSNAQNFKTKDCADLCSVNVAGH